MRYALRASRGLNRELGEVAATPAALIGHATPDGPVKPDPAAVRAALPYRWRKAFDRAGSFWFDDAPNRNSSPAGLNLHDRRGRFLCLLSAFPIRSPTEDATMLKNENAARDAGVRAERDGVKWWSNPHPSGSVEAYEWDQGHSAARRIRDAHR